MIKLRVIIAAIFFCNAAYVIGTVAVDPLACEYGRLVFSTLLYRHGDRSIESTYSNDPYANKSYWPMGFGQLTPIGIERHIKLGKWLRKRYSGWLPKLYSADDVYVRSTDYDRTIMSAQANLIGFYPPVGPGDRDGLSEKRIQLVPIHTVPTYQDNVLAMTANCPTYLQEFGKLENYSEVHKLYSQFNSLFEYIKNNTKLESGKNFVESSMLLYYSLTIESQFNYELPKWTKKIFPEPLCTVVREMFKLPTYTNKMKRLKSGPLLNEIVTHMYEKKNGLLNPDRKLWIYSAHDGTIVHLLDAMKLYDGSIVPYAAVLMIELRLNATGHYVVTVSYRNTSVHEPYLLIVPGCDSVACEFDKFVGILSPMLSVDWVNECKPNTKNDTLDFLIPIIVIFLTAVIIISISYVIAEKIILCFQGRTDYQTCVHLF